MYKELEENLLDFFVVKRERGSDIGVPIFARDHKHAVELYREKYENSYIVENLNTKEVKKYGL